MWLFNYDIKLLFFSTYITLVVSAGNPTLSIFTDRSKAVLLSWIILLFMSCVCHAFASVRCCLVVTCWERHELLAIVCDVYL